MRMIKAAIKRILGYILPFRAYRFLSQHKSAIKKFIMLSKTKKAKPFRAHSVRVYDRVQKSQMDDTVILVFPPYWTEVDIPYGALPFLAGHLLGQGYKVKQYDLNIIHFNKMLNKYQLKVNGEVLTTEKYHRIFHNMDIKSINKIDSDIREMYCNMYLNDPDFDFEADRESVNVPRIIDHLNNRSILEEIYQTSGLCVDIDKHPVLVGFSITSEHQMAVACSYSQIINKISPETKVVFGGGYINRHIEIQDTNILNLFQWADYLIYQEGETALEKLVDYCINRKYMEYAPAHIPNLCYINKNGKMVKNEIELENLELQHPPEYIGVHFEDYLMPEGMITYQASRGCYWQRCAFCSASSKSITSQYRYKSPEKVVRDLVYLKKKYNIKHVQFCDAAIEPKHFVSIIEEMDNHPDFKDIEWSCYSKVSHLYTEEIVGKAKTNGCRMVLFGVETFNKRLSKLICKGIDTEKIRDVFTLFKANNIKIHIWLMAVLPSQTEEDLYEEIECLESYYGIIDNVNIGEFMLSLSTPMFDRPSEYNIININKESKYRSGKNMYEHSSHKNGILVNSENVRKIFKEELLPLVLAVATSTNRYITYFIKHFTKCNPIENYRNGTMIRIKNNSQYVFYGANTNTLYFIEYLKIYNVKVDYRIVDPVKTGLFTRIPIERPSKKIFDGKDVIIFEDNVDKDTIDSIKKWGAMNVREHDSYIMKGYNI